MCQLKCPVCSSNHISFSRMRRGTEYYKCLNQDCYRKEFSKKKVLDEQSKCKVVGCDRPLKILGYCRSHYQRVYQARKEKKEVELKPIKKQRKTCKIAGCKGKHKAKGLCLRHYQNMKYHQNKQKQS